MKIRGCNGHGGRRVSCRNCYLRSRDWLITSIAYSTNSSGRVHGHHAVPKAGKVSRRQH